MLFLILLWIPRKWGMTQWGISGFWGKFQIFTPPTSIFGQISKFSDARIIKIYIYIFPEAQLFICLFKKLSEGGGASNLLTVHTERPATKCAQFWKTIKLQAFNVLSPRDSSNSFEIRIVSFPPEVLYI